MDGKAFKQSVIADLESLKSLELEVIPARIYYPAILKLVFNSVGKLGIVAFLTMVCSFLLHPTHPSMAQESYVSELVDAALATSFMSLAAILLLLQPMNYYFQIKHHLANRLKTGHLLVKKLKQSAYLFLSVFTLFCALFAMNAESVVIFMMIGLSFIVSAIVTYLAISMEMNRVGITLLFTGINQFFSKEKTA